MSEDRRRQSSNPAIGADEDALHEWIDKIHSLPDVRHEKIETIRNAIRDDSYDETELLDATVCRLCDEAELL